MLTHWAAQLSRGDVSVCKKVLTMEVWFETKQPISFHHRQALSWEITFVLNGASGVITALFLDRYGLAQKSHSGRLGSGCGCDS